MKFVTTEFKACILNHITKQRVAMIFTLVIKKLYDMGKL